MDPSWKSEDALLAPLTRVKRAPETGVRRSLGLPWDDGSMSTVFTKIINGEFSGSFAWADDRCAVFASINPITPGHMLVVPREEVARFTDADDALLAHLMWVAKRIGQACERAFEAPRAGLMIAGFEVDHLHIHVMPAWGEAQLNFANAAASVPADELEANTERIRAALTELGYAEDIPADIHSAG